MVVGWRILSVAVVSMGLAGPAGVAFASTGEACFTCDLVPEAASALPPISFTPAARPAGRALADVERDPFADAGMGSLGIDGAARQRSLIAAEDDGLSVRALRRSANRRTFHDTFLAPRDHRSGLGVAMSFHTALDESNALSFALNAGMETRRFAFDRTGHRWSQSRGLGIGAGWIHATSWRLSLGYLRDQGQKRAIAIQRSVELAEGAPAGASGYRLEIAFSPTGFERDAPWSVGLAARSLALSRADSQAMAAPANHDSRLAATLRSRF